MNNTGSWVEVQTVELSGKLTDLLVSSALISEVLLYGSRRVLASISTLIRAYGYLGMCMLLALSIPVVLFRLI